MLTHSLLISRMARVASPSSFGDWPRTLLRRKARLPFLDRTERDLMRLVVAAIITVVAVAAAAEGGIVDVVAAEEGGEVVVEVVKLMNEHSNIQDKNQIFKHYL